MTGSLPPTTITDAASPPPGELAPRRVPKPVIDIVVDRPPLPPTTLINRSTIGDAMTAAGVDEHSPVGSAARQLDAVKRVAACLDHIENRTNDAIHRRGKIESDVATANADDIDEAERQVKILRTGIDAASRMIADTKKQLGLAPPRGKP